MTSTTAQTAQDKASSIRAAADASIDAIRKDALLSDEGRAIRMARVVRDTRDSLKTLRDNSGQARTNNAADAYNRAFGAPTDPMAALNYRDAVTRAAALAGHTKELKAEMKTALARGDSLMCRALAEVAWHEYSPVNRTVGDVVNWWADSDPTARDVLTELKSAQEAGQRSFRDAVIYSYGIPDEVRQHGLTLDALADQDPSPQPDAESNPASGSGHYWSAGIWGADA